MPKPLNADDVLSTVKRLVQSKDPAPRPSNVLMLAPEFRINPEDAPLAEGRLQLRDPLPPQSELEQKVEALRAIVARTAVGPTPASGTSLAGAPLRLDDPLPPGEDALEKMVARLVRAELQGALGERITANVRKLVRREIHRAFATDELD